MLAILATSTLATILAAADPAAQSKTVLNVRDFGARADGKSDDTPAIQRAIKAVSKTGGRVLLPPSESPYLIRGSLIIAADNVQLYGPGATVKLADLAADGRVVDCIIVHGTEKRPVRGVSIYGLTIDGNYWNQRAASNPRGIDSDWATGLLVEKVTIKRAFVGMTFGLGVTHSEARDCKVTQWHNDGFDVSGDGQKGKTHHVKFIRCRAAGSPNEDKGGLPGRRDDAWEIEDGCTDVTLIDCVAENAGGKGFGLRNHNHWKFPVNTQNITFIRCKAMNMTSRGWRVHGDDHRIRITGVRLVDCRSDSESYFDGNVRDVSISGSKFTGLVMIGMKADAESYRNRPSAPAWNVAIENTEFRVLKVNVKPGNDEMFDYQSVVSMRNTTVSKLLEVFGDRKHLITRDCRLP